MNSELQGAYYRKSCIMYWKSRALHDLMNAQQTYNALVEQYNEQLRKIKALEEEDGQN